MAAVGAPPSPPLATLQDLAAQAAASAAAAKGASDSLSLPGQNIGYMVPPFGTLFGRTYFGGGQLRRAEDAFGGRLLTPGGEIAYQVPPFGAPGFSETRWGAGALLRGLGLDGVWRPGSPSTNSTTATVYSVPPFGVDFFETRFSGSALIQGQKATSRVSADKVTITGFDPVPGAVAVGGLETRAVQAAITGRQLYQVFLRRTAAAYVPLTGGPYGAALVSGGGGSGTVRRGSSIYPLKYRATAIASSAAAGRMLLVLNAGQSCKQGYVNSGDELLPAWRDPVGERAWMFDGSAIDGGDRGPRPFQLSPINTNSQVAISAVQLQRIVPLRGAIHAPVAPGGAVAAASVNGQTDAETCALTLLGHLDVKDHVLQGIVGTGATPIDRFLPAGQVDHYGATLSADTAHMVSMKAMLDAALVQATLRGLVLEVVFVWNQGEEDNNLNTAIAVYIAWWRAMVSALMAKCTAIGATWRGAFIQQVEQRSASLPGPSTFAHGQLVAAGDAIGIALYSMLPGHSGGTHYQPLTYLPLGAQTGHAIASLLADSAFKNPYVGVNSVKLTSSTTTVVTWSGGSGTMLFDTTTIANTTDCFYGFSLGDDSGALAISAVAQTGAAQLTFTHAATASNRSAHPYFDAGIAGGVQPMPSSTAPRINFRDDSAWLCPATGQIASGWPICQRVSHTA